MYGNPDDVRVIPAERYRRLQVDEQLPIQKLTDTHPPLYAVSIVQRSSDPTDLALQFQLERDVQRGRDALPDQYHGVPVVYTDVDRERSQEEDIIGGLRCGAPTDKGDGTTTLVAYDQLTDEKVILTARHVTDASQDLYVQGSKAGEKTAEDTAIDAVSYTMTDPSFGDVGTVKEIQNVTGYWTFGGLADTVGQSDDGDSVSDGDTVAVDLYGKESGAVSDNCNNTKRTGKIEYQADMANHRTQNGDSGGPWVDENGKLLALHYGSESNIYGDKWSLGAVGGKVFERLNVGLTPSSVQ